MCERFAEFDLDASGPPVGPRALEPTGAAADGVGVGRGDRSAGVISGDQAISPAVAKAAPQVADGAEGDAEFGGDLRQGLSSEVALDDVLPSGGWDGAGHGVSPRGPIGTSNQEIIP